MTYEQIFGISPAQAHAMIEKLVPRELQVLDLISRGLTAQEIGARIGLAQRTIESYTDKLREKLGTHRAGLGRIWFCAQMVSRHGMEKTEG